MPKEQEYPARVSFRTTREQERAIKALARRERIGMAEAHRRLLEWGLKVYDARQARRAKREAAE